MRKTLTTCALFVTISLPALGTELPPRQNYRIARLPDVSSETHATVGTESTPRRNPLRPHITSVAERSARVLATSMSGKSRSVRLPQVNEPNDHTDGAQSDFRSQVQRVAAQPKGAGIADSAQLVDPIVPAYTPAAAPSNVEVPVIEEERIPFASSDTIQSGSSNTSMLQLIAEQPLLAQRKIRHRLSLDQLLASTIKNNSSVRATDYRILKRTQWPAQGIQPFSWDAYTTTSAPVSEATYRINLNYSQQTTAPLGDTTGSIPNVNRVLRVDVASQDQKLIESLLRQLDAVAAQYWQLVAARGKLIAVTDQLRITETILAKIGALDQARIVSVIRS